MCEPASFVVIKDNGSYIAYWSKNSDSHEVIKKENGLDKLDVDNVRGDYRMIPVEITPPDNDFRLPLKKWVFRAEVVPEWADMADVEVACRVQLKDWLSAKVVLPNEEKERINLGQIVPIYGKVKSISGSAVITTYNNLSPDILKSSKAVMIDRSKDVVQCFVGKDL